MRIKVSNFTIKYNLRAAHIGLETTAAAAARGTRMQTNKLSRPKHILTSDSDLTTSTAVTLRTRVVTSQLTLLTEPGHCSLSLSGCCWSCCCCCGCEAPLARTGRVQLTPAQPRPRAPPAAPATARARHDKRKNIKDAIKIILIDIRQSLCKFWAALSLATRVTRSLFSVFPCSPSPAHHFCWAPPRLLFQ